MKYKYYILFLLLFFCDTAFGQTSCQQMYTDAVEDFERQDFRSAILKLNAAKSCDPAMTKRCDQKILEVFDRIEALRVNAEKARQEAEDNANTLNNILGEITDLMRRDENTSIIGLEPLEQDMFELMLPYFERLNQSEGVGRQGIDQAKVVYSLARSHERFGLEGYDEKYDQSYKLARRQMERDGTINRNADVQEITDFLDISYYHAWNLMDRGEKTRAWEILTFAEAYAGLLPENNIEAQYALGGIYNSLSRYHSDRDDHVASLAAARRALEYTEKAAEQEPNNDKYNRALGVRTKNLYYSDDTVMSDSLQQWYRREGCQILERMHRTPGMGQYVLIDYVSCKREATFEMVREGRFQDAVDSLTVAIAEVSNFIRINPEGERLRLYRAFLSVRLSYISYFIGYSDGARLELLVKAKDDFIKFIAKSALVQEDIWEAKTVLNDVFYGLDYIDELEDKISYVSGINQALESLPVHRKKNVTIARMMAKTSLHLSDLYKEQQGDTSVTHITYLRKTLASFKQSALLKNDSYTEDFDRYAKTYSNLVVALAKQKRFEEAIQIYEILRKIFGPILKLYPYAYFLRSSVTTARVNIGLELHKDADYQQSQPYLEAASYWGSNAATDSLKSGAENGHYVLNNISVDSLNSRSKRQSSKSYTVPFKFGSRTSKINIYVNEHPPEYPYDGVEDQFIWWKEVRGGIVDTTIRNSFQRLFKIARDNNVSYPLLCKYAFDSASEKNFKKDYDLILTIAKSDSLNNGQKDSLVSIIFDKYKFRKPDR